MMRDEWLETEGLAASLPAQCRASARGATGRCCSARLNRRLDGLFLVNGFDAAMEIADADAPRTPRGCSFQAWSLAELLRLDRIVLAEKNDARTQPAPRNI